MSGFADTFAPQRVRRSLARLGAEPQKRFDRIPGLDQAGLTRAAVLIPLTEIEGQMVALFTKRPDSMPTHSGEISFPGGRFEASDRDLRETALREAQEEIALAREDVRLYGALLQMPTVTGFEVTTFVGEFDQPYELQPDAREIEMLFMAPLAALADPEIHRVESRKWQGLSFDLHFYDYQGHVIWGATGYMLHMLLQLVGGDVSS